MSIDVLFNGIVFDTEYEIDGDVLYATSAVVNGYEWIDMFNNEAEGKFNELLFNALNFRKLKAIANEKYQNIKDAREGDL